MFDFLQGNFRHSQAVAPMLRLLIVEDVREDVELITVVLEHANLEFQYEVADSLEQCRTLLTHQIFSAVLADYRLPGLRAPQLFQLVNELQPDAPFILVTGNLGEEAAVECIEAGMTDYVLKDGLYRLPTVLKRALDEAELKRQRRAAIAQIEQQAWRDSVLNRILQAIRETFALDRVLQTTVNQLQIALKVDRCLVTRPSLDQEMVVPHICCANSEDISLLQQPYGLCLPFVQDLRGGNQIVLHRSDEQLSEEIIALLERDNICSALLTPLCYQQDYFGVLTLHSVHQYRPWTKTEISLVKAAADHCAIAIYQAGLYEQAQCELAQRRRIEDQLRYDAFHDALTGLPNRALFIDRLNHALQIAHRHQAQDANIPPRKFAVLFLDLDDFRIVNDSLGHEAGDFLLGVVAQRLSQCLRVGDTLARTSGDEFAILLEDITGIDNITEIVESLQNALRLPITLEAQEIFVSACIGIVINSSHYNEASQFLRDADTAMYQAKAQGRGRYQVFDGSMHIQVRRRLQLENDLRRALDRQEFTLVYQPIMHLPSRKICGFEALVRWHEPTRRAVSPEYFIPLAERTGLIVPLGQWVLHQACSQWKKWLLCWPQKMQTFSVSVNLSAKQFAQPDLIDQIDNILETTNVDSQFLRLEITESALIDNEVTALETLKQLKSRKIKVAMDDFGTGYSSLSYLLRFPKDILKIDKSFVSRLENNPDNQEITKTIITLGNNLGLEVVGEGIETEHQANFLLAHGCVFGQGYQFSGPLTSEAVEELLITEFSEY